MGTPTKYKKPSRINLVSITMLLIFGAIVYGIVAMWPVVSARSNAKGVLADALPHLWRLNLRPGPTQASELTKLRKSTHEAIVKAGVKDKKLEVIFYKEKNMVKALARFTVRVQFPGTSKIIDVPCSPEVETDSAHVEW